MTNLDKKVLNRSLRAARVRAKVSGTTERPRLTVTISNKHVSAQVIDDVKQHTVVAATTIGTKQTGSIADQAVLIGTEIGKKAKKAQITNVVFDRNGRQYAKRLAALADAARKEGLVF
jgi:large subunit ribosomal protein L18